MNEFIILTGLTNGDIFIFAVKKLAIVRGNPTGSDVYIEGVNQWYQVKESADTIAELLRKLSY